MAEKKLIDLVDGLVADSTATTQSGRVKKFDSTLEELPVKTPTQGQSAVTKDYADQKTEKVSPSVVDNVVTFSDTVGVQKDSGIASNELVTSDTALTLNNVIIGQASQLVDDTDYLQIDTVDPQIVANQPIQKEDRIANFFVSQQYILNDFDKDNDKYTNYLGTFETDRGMITIDLTLNDGQNLKFSTKAFITRAKSGTPTVITNFNGDSFSAITFYYRSLSDERFELFYVVGNSSNNLTTINNSISVQGMLYSTTSVTTDDTGISECAQITSHNIDGSFQVCGAFNYLPKTIDASDFTDGSSDTYTVENFDWLLIIVDAPSNAKIQLPTINSFSEDGRNYIFNVNYSGITSNPVTVLAGSGDTINGESSFILTQNGQTLSLVDDFSSNDSKIIDNYLPTIISSTDSSTFQGEGVVFSSTDGTTIGGSGITYKSQSFNYNPFSTSTIYTQYLGTFGAEKGMVNITIRDTGNAHFSSSFANISRQFSQAPIVHLKNNGNAFAQYFFYYRSITSSNFELFFATTSTQNSNVTFIADVDLKSNIVSDTISVSDDTNILLCEQAFCTFEKGFANFCAGKKVDPTDVSDYSGTISAVSDGGNNTLIFTTDNTTGITKRSTITVSGTTSYDGDYLILSDTGTTITVAGVFVASETGAWVSKTTLPYTATFQDSLIYVNDINNATITLPNIASADGVFMEVVDRTGLASSATPITIVGSSGQLINDRTQIQIVDPYGAISVISDSSSDSWTTRFGDNLLPSASSNTVFVDTTQQILDAFPVGSPTTDRDVPDGTTLYLKRTIDLSGFSLNPQGSMTIAGFGKESSGLMITDSTITMLKQDVASRITVTDCFLQASGTSAKINNISHPQASFFLSNNSMVTEGQILISDASIIAANSCFLGDAEFEFSSSATGAGQIAFTNVETTPSSGNVTLNFPSLSANWNVLSTTTSAISEGGAGTGQFILVDNFATNITGELTDVSIVSANANPIDGIAQSDDFWLWHQVIINGIVYNSNTNGNAQGTDAAGALITTSALPNTDVIVGDPSISLVLDSTSEKFTLNAGSDGLKYNGAPGLFILRTEFTYQRTGSSYELEFSFYQNSTRLTTGIRIFDTVNTRALEGFQTAPVFLNTGDEITLRFRSDPVIEVTLFYQINLMAY